MLNGQDVGLQVTTRRVMHIGADSLFTSLQDSIQGFKTLCNPNNARLPAPIAAIVFAKRFSVRFGLLSKR